MILYISHIETGLTENVESLCSVRRGYQVYREVCAACHKLNYLCFRHLTDVCHTADEIKAIAAEVLLLCSDWYGLM